jgi:NADPH2:quinone reductase
MTADLMQAITVRETGGRGDWNTLVFTRVPKPSPGPGEVLVKVEACSVNRADLLQRRGLYPPPPGASTILGLDYAGVVVEPAPDIDTWKAGDRVFGIVAGGGYGRYLAVPGDHLVSVPPNLSFVQAAAAGEVFIAAFLNLFLEAGATAGETLLIHGGGSGVGTAAIQLGKTAGVNVIITAGSDEKVLRGIELGADHGINYKKEDFAARVREITGGKGVHIILDWVGAPYLGKHLDILGTAGRLVIMGLLGGGAGDIDLASLLTKRLRIIGSVLRSRSNQEKALITKAFREGVAPLLASGKVRPVIDRTFPIEAAEEAHLYMKEDRHFGKIVLLWEGQS